jgi:trans-aconitate 2-methyltransferase
MTGTALDVRGFYNEFLKTRMIRYRLDGNLRIEAATRFFLENIENDDIVIDVGCGIGIATEAMAKKAYRGRVIGLDISDRNIWYAEKTVTLQNVSFHCLDIVNDAETVKRIVGASVNVIVLADCLEHIPASDRKPMLMCLAEMASVDAKILVTMPSEWYLEYLRVEDPAQLQIIDNAISAELLDREARDAGFALTYFRLTDMWRKAQYVHCILQRMDTLFSAVHQDVPRESPNSLLRLGTRVAEKLYYRRHRKKKYVDDVFGK